MLSCNLEVTAVLWLTVAFAFPNGGKFFEPYEGKTGGIIRNVLEPKL